MTASSRLLIVLGVLALAACSELNLDPESHRDFAKAGASETAPPADLVTGTTIQP